MRFIALSMLSLLALPAYANVGVNQLSCEYSVNPIGIDVAAPRLAWKMTADRRAERQTAYQVVVGSTSRSADLWDSGKVTSSESVHVAYAGKPLPSRTRAYWKVRVWDRDGKPSAWSAPAYWETGILKADQWTAQWIGGDRPVEQSGAAAPTPYLRRAFTSNKSVKRARLYITALGVYEGYLNGKRIGNDVFAPGWTDYRKRIQYQTYDVTAMLRKGENALGVILADGWYSGQVGLFGRNYYGKKPYALAQLVLDYTDGSSQTINTDGSWKTGYGPILLSDMLMGEEYDARKEIPGWATPGFNDAAWKPVTLLTAKQAPLEAQRGPAVRVTQELKVKALNQPKPNTYVFDLGQNMVGVARLKVRGNAGDTVTLRFAEMLNSDGTIYTTNLRGARCIDKYTLKGGGDEVFEPRFTFRGFRYVEVTGLASAPSKDAITGVVIGSDMVKTGTFECSSPMVNQLQSNISWGQRGNFLSVPTDCPQRDERLGWMGDAQIFIRTGAFNRDVAGFFTKWTIDEDDARNGEGAYADVSPYVACGYGTAAWADAGIICPWTIYLMYGDKRIIEQHYDAMAGYIAYMQSHSDGLIRPAEGYGDWLQIEADTPKDVIATAYFAYSTRLLSHMAAAIGKQDDARKYEALFQDIKAAFNKAFVKEDGRIKGDTQSDYLMALRFDLLPTSKRAIAAKYLVDDIHKHNTHLTTGFVGVGYLNPTLTDVGRTDVAYKLLNNDTFPSWGYSIKYGATTIWERWDGWTKERGFQDPGMNSFNHYSLGSVGQWMFESVAGIGPDMAAPGFKHIILRPHADASMTYARATHNSYYGPIACGWKRVGDSLNVDVTVPANTTATLYLPGVSATEGGVDAKTAAGVQFVKEEDGCLVYTLGSGSYQFVAK